MMAILNSDASEYRLMGSLRDHRQVQEKYKWWIKGNVLSVVYLALACFHACIACYVIVDEPSIGWLLFSTLLYIPALWLFATHEPPTDNPFDFATMWLCFCVLGFEKTFLVVNLVFVFGLRSFSWLPDFIVCVFFILVCLRQAFLWFCTFGPQE
jgi:hypothetical protein